MDRMKNKITDQFPFNWQMHAKDDERFLRGVGVSALCHGPGVVNAISYLTQCSEVSIMGRKFYKPSASHLVPLWQSEPLPSLDHIFTDKKVLRKYPYKKSQKEDEKAKDINSVIFSKIIIPAIKQALRMDPRKISSVFNKLEKFKKSENAPLSPDLWELIFECIQAQNLGSSELTQILNDFIPSIREYGTIDECFRLFLCCRHPMNLNLDEFFANEIGPLPILLQSSDNEKFTRFPMVLPIVYENPVCMLMGHLYVAAGDKILRIGTGSTGTVCCWIQEHKTGGVVLEVAAVSNKLCYLLEGANHIVCCDWDFREKTILQIPAENSHITGYKNRLYLWSHRESTVTAYEMNEDATDFTIADKYKLPPGDSIDEMHVNVDFLIVMNFTKRKIIWYDFEMEKVREQTMSSNNDRIVFDSATGELYLMHSEKGWIGKMENETFGIPRPPVKPTTPSDLLCHLVDSRMIKYSKRFAKAASYDIVTSFIEWAVGVESVEMIPVAMEAAYRSLMENSSDVQGAWKRVISDNWGFIYRHAEIPALRYLSVIAYTEKSTLTDILKTRSVRCEHLMKAALMIPCIDLKCVEELLLNAKFLGEVTKQKSILLNGFVVTLCESLVQDGAGDLPGECLENLVTLILENAQKLSAAFPSLYIIADLLTTLPDHNSIFHRYLEGVLAHAHVHQSSTLEFPTDITLQPSVTYNRSETGDEICECFDLKLPMFAISHFTVESGNFSSVSVSTTQVGTDVSGYSPDMFSNPNSDYEIVTKGSNVSIVVKGPESIFKNVKLKHSSFAMFFVGNTINMRTLDLLWLKGILEMSHSTDTDYSSRLFVTLASTLPRLEWADELRSRAHLLKLVPIEALKQALERTTGTKEHIFYQEALLNIGEEQELPADILDYGTREELIPYMKLYFEKIRPDVSSIIRNEKWAFFIAKAITEWGIEYDEEIAKTLVAEFLFILTDQKNIKRTGFYDRYLAMEKIVKQYRLTFSNIPVGFCDFMKSISFYAKVDKNKWGVMVQKGQEMETDETDQLHLVARFARQLMDTESYKLIEEFIDPNGTLLGLAILGVRYHPCGLLDNYEMKLNRSESIPMRLVHKNPLLLSFLTQSGITVSLPPYNINKLISNMNGIKKVMDIPPIPKVSRSMIDQLITWMDSPARALVLDALCELSINNEHDGLLHIRNDQLMPAKADEEPELVFSQEFTKIANVFLDVPHNAYVFRGIGQNYRLRANRDSEFVMLLIDDNNIAATCFKINKDFPGYSSDEEEVLYEFGICPEMQAYYLKAGNTITNGWIHLPMRQAGLIIVSENQDEVSNIEIVDNRPDCYIPETTSVKYACVGSTLMTIDDLNVISSGDARSAKLYPAIKNEGQRFHLNIIHDEISLEILFVESISSLRVHTEKIANQAGNTGIVIDFANNFVAVRNPNSTWNDAVKLSDVEYLYISLSWEGGQIHAIVTEGVLFEISDTEYNPPHVSEFQWQVNKQKTEFKGNACSFVPTLSTPFTPKHAFSSAISRPGYVTLYSGNEPNYSRIATISENQIVSCQGSHSPETLCSSPFDYIEVGNSEAFQNALFYIRSQITPDLFDTFTRLQSEDTVGQFGTSHLARYNHLLSQERYAELMFHIFDNEARKGTADKKLLDKVIRAISTILPTELETDLLCSSVFNWIITKDLLTEYLHISAEVFCSIEKQLQNQGILACIGNTNEHGARNTNMYCDCLILRPTPYGTWKGPIVLLDRDDNEVSISPKSKLITYMRKELMYANINSEERALCKCLQVSFTKQSPELGFGFAIHFANHIFENIKRTRDLKLAKKFHEHFLLKLWCKFMETKEIPFDAYFAHWLTILFDEDLLDIEIMNKYKQAYNADGLDTVPYSYLRMNATLIGMLCACMSNNGLDKGLIEKYFMNSHNVSKFQTFLASSLLNPLGSQLPFFGKLYPILTRLGCKLLDYPKLTVIEEFSSRDMYRSSVTTTRRYDESVNAVVTTIPPATFKVFRCDDSSTKETFFRFVNPIESNYVANISIVRKNINEWRGMRMAITRGFLAQARSSWNNTFEACCFFIHSCLQSYDCDYGHFQLFSSALTKIFPHVPEHVVTIQLLLTKYRFRASSEAFNLPFADGSVINKAYPALIDIKQFPTKDHFELPVNTQARLSDMMLELSKYLSSCLPHNYIELAGVEKHHYQVNDMFSEFSDKHSVLVPSESATSKHMLDAYTALGSVIVALLHIGRGMNLVFAKFVIRYIFDAALVESDFDEIGLTVDCNDPASIEQALKPYKKQLDAMRLGVFRMRPTKYQSYFDIEWFPTVFQMMPFIDIKRILDVLTESSREYAVFELVAIIRTQLSRGERTEIRHEQLPLH